MKRERTGLDQKKKDIGEKIKVASKAVDDFTVKIEAHESSIDDMRKELDHILENREKKLKMLKGHEQTIAELQQKIAGFVEPDTTEINAKIVRFSSLSFEKKFFCGCCSLTPTTFFFLAAIAYRPAARVHLPNRSDPRGRKGSPPKDRADQPRAADQAQADL